MERVVEIDQFAVGVRHLDVRCLGAGRRGGVGQREESGFVGERITVLLEPARFESARKTVRRGAGVRSAWRTRP